MTDLDWCPLGEHPELYDDAIKQIRALSVLDRSNIDVDTSTILRGILGRAGLA